MEIDDPFIERVAREERQELAAVLDGCVARRKRVCPAVRCVLSAVALVFAESGANPTCTSRPAVHIVE